MPLRYRVRRDEWTRRRLLAGYSGRQAAHKIEVSPNHLNMIERGLRQPSPNVLKRMADLLGVPMTELFDEVRDEDSAA